MGVVIGGSLGVAILSVITFVFCIVVYYIKCSHKKKVYFISNKEKVELGSDINMTSNPSYDINRKNKKECHYNNNTTPTEVPQCLFEGNKQDTIKLEVNPSYGEIQEHETLFYDYVNPPLSSCDIAVQLNPSYISNSKLSGKIPENQDDYVKTNDSHTHSADYLKLIGLTPKEEKPNGTDDVVFNPNPSYESVSEGVVIEDNPSYVQKINL